MRKAIAAAALAAGMLLTMLSGTALATHEEVCTTESSGWVTEQLGDPWVLVDERVVEDEPGGTIVVTEAQHYSYKGGPIEGTPLPPELDPDSWQANTHLEPHYQGGATPANQPDGDPYTDGEGGLHYTSHQSEGLADWFYFQPEVTEDVPPVTHVEYLYEKEVCEPIDHEDPPPTDDPDPPTSNPPPDKDCPPAADDSNGKCELASTGFSAGAAGAAALVLLSLGGAALWYARKLGVK